MADYKQVKIGRLKLKGLDEPSKKKKHKKNKRKTEEEAPIDEDILRHGGWRKLGNTMEVTGNIALQTCLNSYVQATDTGAFVVGELRDDGVNCPAPVETFTAIPLSNKVGIKSGYGKFMSVNMMGDVNGRSDAIGPQEQFELVFEEDRVALQAYNGCFLSVTNNDQLSATKKKAGPNEIFYIRTDKVKSKPKSDLPNEDDGDVGNCELSYVKKFQSYQDKKIKLSQEEKSHLHKAKVDGRLHEEMLNRREKMKADKFCK